VFTNLTRSPFLISPLKTLIFAMIPLNELNTESNIKACNGSSGLPFGAGTLSIIFSRILSTP